MQRSVRTREQAAVHLLGHLAAGRSQAHGGCCCLQVSIPLWALVHLPVVVTLTTAVFTPRGWLHCILYVLFENAMGVVKLGAVIAGARPTSRRLT